MVIPIRWSVETKFANLIKIKASNNFSYFAYFKYLKIIVFKNACLTGWWRCMPLIPALGRQRQVDLSEFEASLVYKGSSRTARAVT